MKKSAEPVKQADRKRLAILSAAKKIFLSQGFNAASMDAIASLADVSKRTVYDHFGDKVTLFKIMLHEHWRDIVTTEDLLFDDKKSIASNLTQFAKTFLCFVYQQETIDIFRLLIAETTQFPDLLDELVSEEKAPFTKLLTDFLQKKKNSGELNIRDAKLAAAYFMGFLKEPHYWPMMLGFTKTKQHPNSSKLIKEAVDAFLKIYQEL